MWFCKDCSLFLYNNRTERTASFFFIHTMVLSVRNDPTRSMVTPKPFPYTCTVTFYTFNSGLLTYANNEYPYTIRYLDKLHASTHRRWVTISACEDSKSVQNHDPQACMEICLCRFCSIASLPIAERRVKT